MDTRMTAASGFVARNGWMVACKPDFRDWALANLQWRLYPPGGGISHAGDTEGALYCIGAGQVSFVAGVGVANIGASYFGLPGMWWGHAPLLGGKRQGSILAVTETICGALPNGLLRARLNSNPEDWRAITLGIAELFTASAGAHADLLIPRSEPRVAATILRLAGYRHRLFPTEPPASIACTQDVLAGAAALSRNTVGKLLRQFERAGLLDARYGRITILDAPRLMTLVQKD